MDRDLLERCLAAALAELTRQRDEMPFGPYTDTDLEQFGWWIIDGTVDMPELIRVIGAAAWEEGFDAGEKDVWTHERTSFDAPCIDNPYRQKE